MRPLKKENGKARNIIFTETLVRFASVTTQEAVRSVNRTEGLNWDQYSVHPAGPELMLMIVSGMTRLHEDVVLISVDGENAFGTIKRSAMAEATARYCPQHGGLLAAQWMG